MKSYLHRLCGAIVLCALAMPLFAQDHSFAETRVALSISDLDPEKQTLVLNVANNLINHYGPDRVAVEVVAFGPGLRLLFEGNANRDRVQSLVDAGVTFTACQNTVAGMTRILGEAPRLNPAANAVPAGVVRLVELERDGYTLIKP